jgi:hypothetical protein
MTQYLFTKLTAGFGHTDHHQVNTIKTQNIIKVKMHQS